MVLMQFLIIFLVSFAGSVIATWGMIRFLRRADIFDHPNERSSHHIPTPRGAGLALMGVIVSVWLLYLLLFEGFSLNELLVIISIVAATGVFWIEDSHGLSIFLRLLVQGLLSAFLLTVMNTGEGKDLASLFQGVIPTPLIYVVAWAFLVWFVNLYNFMDGIDAIAAAETVVISCGVMIVWWVAGFDSDIPVIGMITLGATLGFLVWNWPPAKVFLGDVGSIPLGLLTGWMLLDLLASGFWAAALIIPLYYLMDATSTLFRRAMQGKKFWASHREHFYQKAVMRGLSHGRVSLMVFLCGMVLVGLALLSVWWPLPALVLSAFWVSGFLWVLKGR